ncbi:MAG TPA: peptide deformylase [Chitinophagales bacterium]|nr:peptide deformylase [Chitinophagales bacterium]
MILPIVAYGDSILRKKAAEVEKNHPGLKELIADMFETMHEAPGVGLAAPQIGQSIRLFVVDSEQLFREDDEDSEKSKNNGKPKFTGQPIKEVFINPTIVKEFGKKWVYEEGCLSIPGIREDVERDDTVLIQYYDQDFNFREKEFDGITARIVQHEYDHIEGVLFIDHIKALKRQLLKSKLAAISRGEVEVAYKMAFPLQKKKR